MNHLEDAPIDRSESTAPISSFTEPRRGSRTSALIAALLLVLIAGTVAWYLRGRDAAAPAATPPPAVAAKPSPAPAVSSPAPLPALDASDAFVRTEAARIASDSRLAKWLEGDSLLRRAAAVVAAFGDGRVPTDQLAFLRPGRGFEVRRSDGRTVVSETAYHRWDAATEVFASLDAAAVARLHRRLAPLLDQAWREVGDPSLTFDAALARAIAPLVAVEVPASPPEVVADGAVFRYARPDVESLTAAQKQLLRLGPANARRVQDKLREISAALALPAS